jgi:hypothetical protein
MNATEHRDPSAFGWAAAGIVAAFLVINIATASLTPTVWIDEVLYSDPAVRWHLGQGFTSAGWWTQTEDQFWSANVPGHQVLLCGWLSAFGFGVTAVRSMNYALAAAGAWLLVAALGRAGLVRGRTAKIALLLLLLLSNGITFSYRSGRPDMIGMFLAGVAAFVATLRGHGRPFGLAIVGVLTPIAGLQFVVCGVVVAVVATIARGRVASMAAVIWAAGVAVGVGGLFGLYSAEGTLEAFRAAVFPHTAMAQGLVARLAEIPKLYVQDWSLPVVVVTLLVVALTGGRDRRAAWWVALTLLIPPALFVAGRYPVYYTWMGFIPAAVALAILLDGIDRAPCRWAMCGAIAACMVGLPLRLGLALVEYQARDYRRVDALLLPAIRADDLVLCDYAAYYPCRAKARDVWLPRYLEVAGPADKLKVTALVCPPDQKDKMAEQLGGEWTATGEKVEPVPPPSWAGPLRRLGGGAQLYNLAVFRRAGTAGAAP